MPISALQHRISTGNHQNYRKPSNNIINTVKIKPNCSTFSDDTHHFTLKIAYIHNAPEILNTQSYLHKTPQNVTTMIIQFMLLLSQIKNSDYPILDTHHDLQFIPEKKILLPASDYALQHNIDSYELNTIWKSVTNAFNTVDKFISQHDPLQFPRTDAAPLNQDSNLSYDFESEMNSRGINIIARNLAELKYIDRNKYKFFKRTAYNAIKLLNSTIQQLSSKENSKTDDYMKYYSSINTDFFRQELILLYAAITSEIKDMLKNNRNSVYYGYSQIHKIETHKIANMVLMNDKKRRMLLTDKFFKLCTVCAIEMLIHEMGHFHSKIDLFLIAPDKSCLINYSKTSEMSIQNQLDEATNIYTYSINNLKEDDIPTAEAIFFMYKTDKKHFVETFNTNETFREEAIFINADSITRLAIALGNYGFKKNNIMPLRNIVMFKN